jgi:LytS/YehU family sensor histidine kinase
MQDNLFPIDDKHFSPRYIVTSLIINAVVNTLIALILTAIGFGKDFVVTLVFSQCIGMSIYLANLVALRLFRTVTRAAYQVTIIVAAVMLGAFAGTVLGALANGYDLPRFIRQNSTFFAQIVLIALLFGSIVSYVFFSLAKLSEEKIKRLDMGKNAAEAELKLLQSQMEPHFLFNTLSNVTSLMDNDREKAKHMLESFTAFLRGSLMTARQRTVTLTQEMDVVKNYLDVYSVRMGDRLFYRIDIPDSLRHIMIPPLLIQPLVENAVKHGLEPAITGGEISIQAKREGDAVRITVADSGMGIDTTGTGNNIGIGNIRKRLELMYGDRGQLFLEENKPRGVKVVVEIPYETGTSDHS